VDILKRGHFGQRLLRRAFSRNKKTIKRGSEFKESCTLYGCIWNIITAKWRENEEALCFLWMFYGGRQASGSKWLGRSKFFFQLIG
jgi:hypothetical protein